MIENLMVFKMEVICYRKFDNIYWKIGWYCWWYVGGIDDLKKNLKKYLMKNWIVFEIEIIFIEKLDGM